MVIGDSIKPHENSAKYLRKKIYRPGYGPEIRAVGFKLFYNHRVCLDKKGWNMLRKWKVHIIHLQRRNLLNQFLSYKLALRKWRSSPESLIAYDHPILLDSMEFLEYTRRITSERRNMNRFFRRNPCLGVEYSDFTSDIHSHLFRIHDFLNVDRIKVEIKTGKLKKRLNSNIIMNYQELKEVFTESISDGIIPRDCAWWFDEEASLD